MSLSALADFIAKYWLDFLFGLIVSGCTFLCGWMFKMYKKEKNAEIQEQKDEFSKEMDDKLAALSNQMKTNDCALQDQIDVLRDEFETLRIGILSVQGDLFKKHCRTLLQSQHTITLEEYEDLEEEHKAYKRLGGNHNGDILYAQVKKKFENNI